MSIGNRKIWGPESPFDVRKLPFHYGWVIILIGAIGQISSMPGQTMGVNVFSEMLIVDLDLTRTQVSMAYLIGTMMSALMLPYAGQVLDQFGPRRLMVYACIGLGLSLVFLSQSDRIAIFLSQEWRADEAAWEKLLLLTGGFFLIRFLGQGVITMATINMVGKWWDNYRGMVLSLTGVLVSVCFSTTPLIFDALINSYGWRQAWILLGGIIGLGAATFFWLTYRDNPEVCGLEKDAGMPAKRRDQESNEFKIVKEFNRSEALSTYSFWIFALLLAVQGLYITGYTFHVVSIGEDVGLAKETILALFIPAAVIGGALSLFVGWASDRWPLKYVFLVMGVGMSFPPIGMIMHDPVLMPTLIAVGLAVTFGCSGVLTGAFLPRFFGLQHLGSISGFFMSVLVFFSAAGPILFSLAYDIASTYEPAHWGMLGVCIVLAIGAFWGNNPQRKLIETG